jgi:anti-sigma regulatory factor (Ser/Thr protein kinase)
MTSRADPEPSSGTGTAFHLASALQLAPLPTAISCARLHAVNVLHEWGLGALADDAALVVSELMTNARAAAMALDDQPPIALRLLADHERLIIEAWDQSPYDLDPFEPDDDSENGRGLMIVEALSQRWGSSRVGYNGKVVWAEMRRPMLP